MEILLENRKVTDCSDSENAGSLHRAAGAVGILGLDSDRNPIAQAKYDEITCYPVSSTAEAIENIGQMTANPEITQVDGALFLE